MNVKQSIDAFLAEPAMAIVGMSRSGAKFGNAACRELRAKGYRVYPIHPGATTIDGLRCYSRLEDLPERVAALLVVVPSSQAAQVVRDAARNGVRHVWLQQGAESPEVLAICRELGIDVVSGECVLMFAAPTGFHKAHRWLRGVFGRLPV
jgi:uncharacterized protein